jgi:nucleoside-diphosphate-sugar epimerase
MPRHDVVLTGVTSFLGFHIARAFARAGYRVIGTYKTPPEQLSPVRRARWRCLDGVVASFAPLDITDPIALRRFVQDYRPQLWVHQAGLGANFAADDYDLEAANRINLVPLEAIFANLAELGCPAILTGSGMEYGAAAPPNREDAACWPGSPYGVARLAATLRSRQLSLRYRVPARVARVYSIFGEHDEAPRVVPRLFAQLAKGENVAIAPGVARDMCDVSDVASGYVALAADLRREPLFDIFNLSRGEATPLRALADGIACALGRDPSLVKEDPSFVRANEPLVICGDSAKARERLGWSARPIEEGIARLVEQNVSPPPLAGGAGGWGNRKSENRSQVSENHAPSDP